MKAAKAASREDRLAAWQQFMQNADDDATVDRGLLLLRGTTGAANLLLVNLIDTNLTNREVISGTMRQLRGYIDQLESWWSIYQESERYLGDSKEGD